ncbi:MAG: YdiY family protein [Solirubrobacterales bacterium]
MSRTVSAAILCVLACATAAFSDEVQLKNGDRLTGQIVKLTEGKLVLKSQLAGEITINLSDIKTFSSEGPIEVHLKDGTVLRQPVAAAEPNEFAISAGEPLKPQSFKLADVAAINPPPKPAPKWEGSVSGAVSSTHGNTKAEAVSASVSVSRRSEKDRTTAGADYGKTQQRDRDSGEDETTEDWWRARAQYDYFFTKKFFGFINGRYEKDAIADLDRRVVVGGGGGYQWIESDRTSFSTNLGLASLYEKFDVEPPADDSNSQLSLQAGYNFDHRITDTLRFVHDLTYYPSLEKFSDYYLTTTAELRANLTKTMFANFRVIFNYDESPAPGRGGTDVKYLLGVGLTF